MSERSELTIVTVSERSELTIVTAINDHWRHHPVERLHDVHELMVPQ